MAAIRRGVQGAPGGGEVDVEKGEKVVSLAARRAASAAPEVRREPDWLECDACGSPLQTLGHCKYLCRTCGFMRTCMDTV
ncbi:hypothetical protein KGQ64_10840 [bacterium]|nr:hypothetical protein [bacterium]